MSSNLFVGLSLMKAYEIENAINNVMSRMGVVQWMASRAPGVFSNDGFFDKKINARILSAKPASPLGVCVFVCHLN